MIQRIAQALDAIRYSDQEGLETELDLLAFADDVLAHYAREGLDSILKNVNHGRVRERPHRATPGFVCPESQFHGNPFRYCGVKGCGWMENE